ncbi:MAG: prepilin-type N-terminal cleavage/methylation domain-containing protein [Phycisphaerales bacterium]|nr:MAG: prepilin-type N-terminal cleavage/methylation domain-containing protein [Phycisphaerales bacterium]
MVTTRFFQRRVPEAARPGFTLIELLVVLVIVGLLVGAVAPSLEVARQRSKDAVCHTRLRSIGIASGVYAEWCPNGYGIPVHPLQFCQCPSEPCDTPCYNPIFIGAYEWGGKSGVGRDDFLWGSPGDPLNSKYGTKAGFGPATRPMNEILYPGGFRDAWQGTWFDRIIATKDTKLELPAYRCPADDGPPGGAHCPDWVEHARQSSYDHFGNSYAANTFMTASSSGGWMRSNSPYLRPLSRVPNPARTINFEENIGRWAWACRREACDFMFGIDPGPTKAVRGWHGKNWTFNHVYADGHTGVGKMWIEGTEDADGYATHYRVELVYPDDPSLQQEHRCIIVRGDGWQKDTLPDEPIPTLLYHGGYGRPSYEGCVRED